MSTLEKLRSTLDVLLAQRTQVVRAGWFLQDCWLVQVKPGGTARTDCKYWQVRSRRPLFEGKKLKHLKLDEVEEYRGAIERGRQLKQIEHQIQKLQEQLQPMNFPADAGDRALERLPRVPEAPVPIPKAPTDELEGAIAESQRSVTFTNLTEQELFVQELLAKTQALRASLRQSATINQQLRAGMKQRQGNPPND